MFLQYIDNKNNNNSNNKSGYAILGSFDGATTLTTTTFNIKTLSITYKL